MNLRELLQNRNILIAIGVILVVVLVVGISIAFSNNNLSSKDPDETTKIDGKVDLVTSENLGKISDLPKL